MNIIDELKWRGAVNQQTDEEDLYKLVGEKSISLYCGIDPTGDSMHIGHLIPFMIMKRFQLAGHHPVILIGGGTGSIGDPSGRKSERVLQSMEQVQHNAECLKEQMKNLFGEDGFRMVNNYDWLSKISLLDFLRDYGKLFNINTMLAKDIVASRLDTGISFTEFSYQILQSIDFKMLYDNYDVQLQIGGADQWGNITTGTELIRRMLGQEAYAITCPLIKKADGTKFGKTESGNVWLDPRYTSPYKFYQFWLNVSDEDAKNYIKIFTLLDRQTVESLIAEHEQAPHLRVLQKRLAKEITSMIHSPEEYEKAVEASNILFGNSTADALRHLDEQTLLQVFEGVPQFTVSKAVLGVPFVELTTEHCNIFPSKGETRKLVQGGGVSLNKEKVTDPMRPVTAEDLIAGKYLLVQKGKKNYYLVTVE